MLTEKQISDYRQNGFVSGIRIMEPETAAEYRRQYEASFAHRLSFAMVDSNHKAASKFDIREFRPHLYFKWAADLMYTPALVDAVSALLGPDLLVWETRIFAKPAHSSSYISWHQDLTYWGLDLEYEEVTAWVALSPSTPESGCMRVLPGSHKQDIVGHVETDSSDNLLSRGQELAVTVDESEAVDLMLQPGEISLHHGKIFHSSRPNRSGDARIGFAVRCLPTQARPVEGRQFATLLSGEDTYNNFDLIESARNNQPSDSEVSALARKLIQ